MTEDRYAPPRAALDDVQPASDTPALWNPGAAAAWSLLFSPAFGSYLQMLNWRALGETQRAESSRMWFFASVGLTLAMAGLGLAFPESQVLDVLSRVWGLAYLVVWFTSSGKLQIQHVKERFGTDYERKKWGQPLLIAVVVMSVFLGALVGLAFLSVD